MDRSISPLFRPTTQFLSFDYILPSLSLPPSLENLPLEIYSHIFKYLSLDDLLDLKATFKNIHTVIQSFRIYGLICSRLRSSDIHILSNEFQTRFNHTIFQTNKKFLIQNPTLMHNLIKLKFLDLGHLKCTIDCINKFSGLKVLVFRLTNFSPEFNPTLDLPKLVKLSIFVGINVFSRLDISAPNMKYLALNSVDNYVLSNNLNGKLNLIYPQSVESLRIKIVDAISIFTNLKCLETNKAEYFSFNCLSQCKSLKKFKFQSLKFEVRNLMTLLNEMTNLQISILGFQINDSKDLCKLISYKESKIKSLGFQLANYHHLENDLDFFTKLNYTELSRIFPSNQPDDLFRKFINIKKLSTGSKVSDKERLLSVIKSCPNLFDLKLKESECKQDFYDRLPSVSSIVYLEINQSRRFCLNLDFIGRMYYLRRFLTNQDILIENSNLNNLRCLEILKFRFGGKQFQLKKYKRDDYRIQTPTNNCDFSDLDKVIKKFSKIKTRSQFENLLDFKV